MMRKFAVAFIAVVLGISSACKAEQFTVEDAAKLSTEALIASGKVKSVRREAEDILAIVYSPDTESSFFLGNLLIALNADPAAAEETVARFVSIALKNGDMEPDADIDSTKQRIIPIVRHTNYVDYINNIFDEASSKKNERFSKRLAADYWVLLALDEEGSISIPPRSDFAKLAMSDQQLLALAASNLKQQYLPQLRIEKTDGLHMMLLDGNFEVSILVIDEFWRNEAARMSDNIVLVAPARDIVMYCAKSDLPCASRIQEIAQQNIDALANAISTELIEWDGSVWREYQP